MRFLVASLDSGLTLAPDGEEFENMQIIAFVEAINICEARRKFFAENKYALLHGYGSKYKLKFYVCEDSEYPEDGNNFFEYSSQDMTMHFWGTSLGDIIVPLDNESARILEDNGVEENEILEFSEEVVLELYKMVLAKCE